MHKSFIRCVCDRIDLLLCDVVLNDLNGQNAPKHACKLFSLLFLFLFFLLLTLLVLLGILFLLSLSWRLFFLLRFHLDSDKLDLTRRLANLHFHLFGLLFRIFLLLFCRSSGLGRFIILVV